MRRILLSVVLFALLASGCGSGGSGESVLEALGLSENVDIDAPPGSELSGAVDDVAAQLEQTDFNGVVLVDNGGDLRVLAFGTADGADGPLVDQDTVFDIGSITKQFTGAAIVRLEMDGMVSVDDPVGMYLPELAGGLADVTLHQLLTHTAGLPDGIGDDYESIDRADFLQRAMDRAGEPGPHQYSNVGYSLLGMVIESVTGGSYEQYLNDALFMPAGMTSTGYVLPDWEARTVAVGYDGDDRLEAPNELPWAEDGPWWNLRANGGILSTAADMRRWIRALDGEDVLSADAKDKLFGRHALEADGGDTYYGYGWVSFPYGEDGWFHGHNGGNGIFFADLLRFPDDDLTIFVATNTSRANEDITFLLAGELLDVSVGAGCAPLIDPTTLPIVDSFPESTTGSTASATVDVLLDGDDASRRSYAENHVTEELAQGLSLDEQVEALAGLSEEFIGYTVHMIHAQDANTFHVILRNSAVDGDARLSLVVDENREHVSCIDVEFP